MMEDFSYSVRIHESILISFFTRYLQRLFETSIISQVFKVGVSNGRFKGA